MHEVDRVIECTIKLGLIRRWDFCYFLFWRPQPVRYRWCSAWLWWRRVEFQQRWCIRDPLRPAWRFKWRPGSRVRAQKGRYPCSHLRQITGTSFVGGSEVILDSFDNVGLDILLLFEGDGWAIDELAVTVLGDSRGGCSGLGGALLDFGGKLSNSSGQVCQHVMI